MIVAFGECERVGHNCFAVTTSNNKGISYLILSDPQGADFFMPNGT